MSPQYIIRLRQGRKDGGPGSEVGGTREVGLTKYLGHNAGHGPERFGLLAIGPQKRAGQAHFALGVDIGVEASDSQSLPALHDDDDTA